VSSDRTADLEHIAAALQQAAAVLLRHAAGKVTFTLKDADSPVTAADREVDDLLRRILPRAGDGWLSEESLDDGSRLQCRRVWVVDPLDGTRSFVAGRSDYAVSIALVEDGVAVLGGIGNPPSGVCVLGGPGLGVRTAGSIELAWPVAAGSALRVLCSRSEWRRGEWQRWQQPGLAVLPVGSVAYKLALVAAGAADATWTLQNKHEWDVAAGAALVRAAGGTVWIPGAGAPVFNRQRPLFPAFAAATGACADRVAALLSPRQNH